MSGEEREITELVGKAGGRGAEAQAAAARLVEIGMPAVPAVVEAVRRTPLPSEALLGIIPRIEAPELTDAMLEVLNDPNAFVSGIASQVLGRSKDARAFQPLLDLFVNENRGDSYRSDAAEALAELGDKRAVPLMVETVKAIARRRQLAEHAYLIRYTAVALARLGNQELAEIVIRMSGDRNSEAREEVLPALKHVVGRGLFPALQKSRRRRSQTARNESLKAIFYLGLRESVEEFISVLERTGDDLDFRSYTVQRLNDLTGADFAEDAEAARLREWWAQHQSDFLPRVCYRLGRPLRVSDFARLEAKDFASRYLLLQELYIVTGQDFGRDSRTVEEQDEPVARAREWVSREGAKFEEGAVYKHGYKQEIGNIFDPL